MSDENYILLESFQIDDGELEGLSPQECFVLGYELAVISKRAELEHDEFIATIHADNRKRIELALAKRGRPHIVTWFKNDQSEGWLQLTVMRRV